MKGGRWLFLLIATVMTATASAQIFSEATSQLLAEIDAIQSAGWDTLLEKRETSNHSTADGVALSLSRIEIPPGEELFSTSIPIGQSQDYSILSASTGFASSCQVQIIGLSSSYFGLSNIDAYLVALYGSYLIYNIEFTISVSSNAPAQTFSGVTLITNLYNSSGSRIGGYTRSNIAITTTGQSQVVADFRGTPTTGTNPLTVNFTDLSTGLVLSRQWNFGDGQTSSEKNPVHIFQNSGSYTVTLTVTGSVNTDVKTRDTYITATAPVPPIAAFSASPTSGFAPLAVVFSDQSTGTVSSWEWDFGDGQTSTSRNPSHTYQDEGVYSVTLTAKGPAGENVQTRAGYIQVTMARVNWVTIPTSSTADWMTIHFADARTGWIAGGTSSPAANQIYKTVNSGLSWQETSAPGVGKIADLFFVDTNNGFLLAPGGIIQSTSDGGASWKLRNSGTVKNLASIYAVDRLKAWVVGEDGIILNTQDGGKSWPAQASNTNKWLRGVHFEDNNTGWAVGDGGTILKTTDGGTSWKSQNSGVALDLFAVQFVDLNSGWAVGHSTTENQSVILSTLNGGQSWVGYTVAGKILHGLCFSDALTGWVFGDKGVIMATPDGGKRWVYENSLTTATLRAAAFISGQSGWVVGDGGVVRRYPNAATDVESRPAVSLPEEMVLWQNYPNPFNGGTTLIYVLKERAEVDVALYTMRGSLVKQYKFGLQEAGEHRWQWSSSDVTGYTAPSGLYIMRLRAGNAVKTQKWIMVK